MLFSRYSISLKVWVYTFTSNNSYTYLTNVEPSDLVFLKTYNTEFDEFIIIFNGSKRTKYVKRYRFLSFAIKYQKQILNKD